MNRPIKFRVWLPSLNRFSDDNSVFMNCYGKLYGVTKPSLVDDSQSIVNIGQFKELNGYTIQWYTGLTDKNNKEIYEGDIVKEHRFDDWTDKEGYEYRGVVRHKIYDTCDEKRKFSGFITFPNELENKNYSGNPIHSDCEVIGNIFENIKLLK
jgi:uncharacterized phage protein (TIGR01671 family)